LNSGTGSPRPLARRPWKNPRTVSTSSFGARHRPQEELAPVLAMLSGKDSLAPLTRPKPLGDAVDEHVDDCVLGKITLGELFVSGPQPLGDLAHRRPRQKPSARLVGEGVLDVARR
jgi:hypothetical protein